MSKQTPINYPSGSVPNFVVSTPSPGVLPTTQNNPFLGYLSSSPMSNIAGRPPSNAEFGKAAQNILNSMLSAYKKSKNANPSWFNIGSRPPSAWELKQAAKKGVR